MFRIRVTRVIYKISLNLDNPTNSKFYHLSPLSEG